MNRFSIDSPIKFKGETTVKDHNTGKSHDATVYFTSRTGVELSEDRKVISFGVIEGESAYEIVIEDKEA